MQTFKINIEGLTKRLLVRSIPTVLIALVIWFSIFHFEGGTYEYPIIVIVPVVFILGLLSFSIWRGIKRQKALLESYELTISDQLICREQLNTPDISILVTEVVEIAKYPKGGFSIKGSRNNGTIIIPVQVENYEQLEATLQQIHPITIKRHSFLKKFQSLLSLISLALMVCVFLLTDKIIVGTAGCLLTALMIWSLVRIQKDKNIDRKTRNGMWAILLFLASIIGVTILKVTA
jgi:hypothetical protein